MAFATDVISCTSDGMCSDMWNFCSDTHPDLHDNFMDPPKLIMVSPGHENYPHCSSEKERKAFDIYYGEQTAFQCAYTTSAVIELHTGSSKCKADLNNNVKTACDKDVPIKPSQTRHSLAVPGQRGPEKANNTRRKSDSDLKDFDGYSKSRVRNLSGEPKYKPSKPCKCECTCGVISSCPKQTRSPVRDSQSNSLKTKQKSKGLKTFLQNILS